MAKEKLVGSGVIAEIFGVDPRRVQQLTKEGIITARREGNTYTYDLLPTISQYIKYLSDKANGREKPDKSTSAEMRRLEAEADLKRSKADIAALELKEFEGKMHRSEDVEAMTTDLVSTIKGLLLALPNRCAIDTNRSKSAAEAAEIIKREVYKILNILSEYKYDSEKYAKKVREREGWQGVSAESGDNADESQD